MLLLCISVAAPAFCIPPSAASHLPSRWGPSPGGGAGGAASTAAAGVRKVPIGIARKFKWVWNSVWGRGPELVKGLALLQAPVLRAGGTPGVLCLLLLLYWLGMSLLNGKVASTFPSPLFAPVLLFLHSSADIICIYGAVLQLFSLFLIPMLDGEKRVSLAEILCYGSCYVAPCTSIFWLYVLRDRAVQAALLSSHARVEVAPVFLPRSTVTGICI